jgi:hypothetical protein
MEVEFDGYQRLQVNEWASFLGNLLGTIMPVRGAPTTGLTVALSEQFKLTQ